MAHTKAEIVNRKEYPEPLKTNTHVLGMTLINEIIDCRVVFEPLFLDMQKAYDVAPELLEALTKLTDSFDKAKLNIEQSNSFFNAIQAIKKAK